MDAGNIAGSLCDARWEEHIAGRRVLIGGGAAGLGSICIVAEWGQLVPSWSSV